LLAMEPGYSNAPEVVSVLVGTNQCQIAMRPGRVQSEGANRLNHLLGSRIESVAEARTTGLASSLLCSGLVAPPILQFIVARMLDGETEADAETWLQALSPSINPEKIDTVRKVIHRAIE